MRHMKSNKPELCIPPRKVNRCQVSARSKTGIWKLSEAMRRLHFVLLLAAACAAQTVLASGNATTATTRPQKFRRVWTFTGMRDEEFARKIAALNVQNVRYAAKPELRAIARKYGLRSYISAGAWGVHKQVMTSEENAALEWLRGEQPPSGLQGEALKQWKTEHKKANTARLREAGYAYGGEPQPGREKADVLKSGVYCFVGPIARSNSVAHVLEQPDRTPDAEMVLFDYVGYQNYRRCHHPDCERLYREFLAKRHLEDAPGNEKEFFLGELVAVNNAMHDAIKARNPAIITGTHVYPVYLPEPLYGHRLKFDVIGETCAWYLKWPDEKIRAYATDCLSKRPADYPRSRRVPFIAITRNDWCPRKSAADVERELNDLLDAGVDEIVAFEMNAIVDDPELYAVFLKYCGSNPPPQ